MITCIVNFGALSSQPTPAVTSSSSSSIQATTGVSNPQFIGSRHTQTVQHATTVSSLGPVTTGVSRAMQSPSLVSSSVVTGTNRITESPQGRYIHTYVHMYVRTCVT